MSILQNPILSGFNPDPSIVRVGDSYYIATSTFEWFPGVQIHHSKDLINWELIARPLNRIDQLDLKGVPDSCGVWAPCLTHHEGTFYLVYSNVRSFQGVWKDTPNYLVTTRDIRGDWSDPIFLSSSGFDGSMFHDPNGRKWYTSLVVDHRRNMFFGGIMLQEYDPNMRKLVGESKLIFEGTALGKTEGPHIYKIRDYYYLITAEGGTEYDHAVTVARAKRVTGPYEVHPDNPILTANDQPSWPLQKNGHADIVQQPNGEWNIVFLTSRPLSERGKCTLGRETAIEQLTWNEGWPYLKTGKKTPRLYLSLDGTEYEKITPAYWSDSFDQQKISIDWQTLRIPMDPSWITVDPQQKMLTLYGRESLSSLHLQSLIARRVQDFNIEASVSIQFEPSSFQQMAGLVFYYNTKHFHYLHVTYDDRTHRKILSILSCDNGKFTEPVSTPIKLEQKEKIHLKGCFNYDKIQFYYASNNSEWMTYGPVLDGSILSDDYVREGSDTYQAAFTGSFVGLCCQDLSGRKISAHFQSFNYQEIKENHEN